MRKRPYLFIVMVFAFNVCMLSQSKKYEVVRDSVIDIRDNHVYKMIKI